MEDFLVEVFEESYLEELNRCILFLKATRISDISIGVEIPSA